MRIHKSYGGSDRDMDTFYLGGRQFSAGNMIRNRVFQDIHEVSAIANFTLGTRMVMDDRVFRYCYAEVGMYAMKSAHCNVVPVEVTTDSVVRYIGSKEITILDTEVRAVDYYKDGYIWIMKDGHYQFYRIKSSAVGDGVSVTLTLWEILRTDIRNGVTISAWPCIYGQMGGGDSSYKSIIAVPLVKVDSERYFWGQTWGPIFGTVSNSQPGITPLDRELYFDTDGELISSIDLDFSAGNPFPQRAGFLISNSSPGGAGYGDQLYMLQISP